MERRRFIETAALFTAGLVASSAKATTIESASEGISAKATPSALIFLAPGVVKVLPSFAETAVHCALSGELCVQHCSDELAKGEVVFSNCLVASSQMVVVCELVSKLAALKSIRLSETLDACAAACKACKEACDEHKSHWSHGMHLECKACSEHCEKMITEISKLKIALAKA